MKAVQSFLAIILIVTTVLITGCSQAQMNIDAPKVGLLVPETINDPVWGSKGYKGLLKIQSDLGAEVFYKENVETVAMAEEAIKEFQDKGVELVFGHGNEYEPIFMQLDKKFPDLHFVYFNGTETSDNITSVQFNAYAMGFFGGMVAGKMTKSDRVGVIAAYGWQPEVKGFRDGAEYENKDVNVSIHYTENWDDKENALKHLDEMLVDGVDVFYPAGDLYNIPVIKRVKEEGLYAIGFISEQSDLGEATVLTSTVQHVSDVYKILAEDYMKGELKSGVVTLDFQEDAISMGKFSPEVPKSYKAELKQQIEKYRETGKLPNEN
ncbi:BMP family ABC transporter substrate-binding protein [Bacillus tianshenii]|nr:BMP family ABC transporter substrate-binding protein [Bacillus tianshenii]